MPIRKDVEIVSPDDGKTYKFLGRMFKDVKTGRFASVGIRLGLEREAIRLGMVYGEDIFQDILRSGISGNEFQERSMEAIKFLKSTAGRFGTSNMRGDIMNIKEVGVPRVGSMVGFFYEAKMKGVLPYWDYFPIDFILGFDREYMTGINLHYLRYDYRVMLMDALYNLGRIDEGTSRERLDIDYRKLVSSISSSTKYKACIKKYIIRPQGGRSYIKSRMVIIPPESWSIVSFLPVQQFVKDGLQRVDENQVWKDSESKY